MTDQTKFTPEGKTRVFFCCFFPTDFTFLLLGRSLGTAPPRLGTGTHKLTLPLAGPIFRVPRGPFFPSLPPPRDTHSGTLWAS